MPPKPDPLIGFKTALTVGEILRRARLKKNLSLHDIEEAIRVSAQHLEAIEDNRLEMLPGRIYTIGFIKAYADHVGIDSVKLLALLKRQTGRKQEPKNIMPQNAAVLDDFSLPTGKIFVIVFILLVSVFSFKSFYQESSFLLEQDIPKVPQDLIVQTTLLSKPVQPVQKQQEVAAVSIEPTAPPPPTNQIVLKAIENVWLEIRDDQKQTVFSRVLSMGEEYWVPVGQQDLTMTLGNAGGLLISIDGQPLPLLGKTGQVVRKVPLNIENLKQSLKPEPKNAM